MSSDYDPNDFLPAESELGFTWEQAQTIVRDYACPCCFEALVFQHGGNEGNYRVECPEHGDVEIIGRVKNSSANFQCERAHFEQREVLINMPDLFQLEEKSKRDPLKELGF